MSRTTLGEIADCINAMLNCPECGAGHCDCECPTADTHGLPKDADARKGVPLYRGLVRYFPLALAEVARVSQAGNAQHHPDEPLHWDRNKSGDELDALLRHLWEADERDTDGQWHAAKVAWRALAYLQKHLERVGSEGFEDG